MSIIGPRPLVKKTYDAYAEDVKECISKVTPGLSGIGSIVFRDEEDMLNAVEDRD
jgi:lipopolysaccharide/colanic/teichoic acid biosynthesis glycosyltransferase